MKEIQITAFFICQQFFYHLIKIHISKPFLNTPFFTARPNIYICKILNSKKVYFYNIFCLMKNESKKILWANKLNDSSKTNCILFTPFNLPSAKNLIMNYQLQRFLFGPRYKIHHGKEYSNMP